MADAESIPGGRVSLPSNLQQQQAVWRRGCVLAGAFSFVAILALSVPLYLAHQRPCLNAPPERINPNTASLASLVRLPSIGKARALDIMDCRDHHQQDGPAFQSPQDLEQIRGIGPKTVANIAPWLTFEQEPRMNTKGKNGPQITQVEK